MIYVPQDKSARIEFLLQAARCGVHPLFDLQEVRQSLTDPTPLSLEETYAAEPLLERILVQSPDWAAARAAWGDLPARERHHVIRTYFAMVENQVYSEEGPHH